MIYRQKRDIMEKESLITDVHKQLQSRKEDHFANEKGNIFKETLRNSEREKNERVGCIHFSKLLR